MQVIFRRLVVVTLLTLAVQPGRLTMAQSAPAEDLERLADALGSKANQALYDKLFSAGLCETIASGPMKGGVSIKPDAKGSERVFLQEVHQNRQAFFKGMAILEGNASTQDAFTQDALQHESALPKPPPPPDDAPANGPKTVTVPPPAKHNTSLTAIVEVSPFTVTAAVLNGGMPCGDVYERRRNMGKEWKVDATVVEQALTTLGVPPGQIIYFWNTLESPATTAPNGGPAVAQPAPQAFLEKAYELAVPPARRKQTLFLHVGESCTWAAYTSPRQGGIRTVELPYGPFSIMDLVNSQRKPDESFLDAAKRVRGKISEDVANRLAANADDLKDLKRIVMSGSFLWSFRTLSGNGTANAIESFSIRAFSRSDFLIAAAPGANSVQEEVNIEFITRELYSRDQLVSGSMLLDALNTVLNLDRKKGLDSHKGYPAVSLELDRLALIKAFFLQKSPSKQGDF